MEELLLYNELLQLWKGTKTKEATCVITANARQLYADVYALVWEMGGDPQIGMYMVEHHSVYYAHASVCRRRVKEELLQGILRCSDACARSLRLEELLESVELRAGLLPFAETLLFLRDKLIGGGPLPEGLAKEIERRVARVAVTVTQSDLKLPASLELECADLWATLQSVLERGSAEVWDELWNIWLFDTSSMVRFSFPHMEALLEEYRYKRYRLSADERGEFIALCAAGLRLDHSRLSFASPTIIRQPVHSAPTTPKGGSQAVVMQRPRRLSFWNTR